MTWVRQRGREDYVGWVLDIRGTRARAIVGHPLWRCLVWLVAWWLWPRRFRDLDLCGDVVWMRLDYRRAP